MFRIDQETGKLTRYGAEARRRHADLRAVRMTDGRAAAHVGGRDRATSPSRSAPFKVIHGVDLGIEDGEFVALVGPSGCGKSTLLRMIAGLEELTGGEILIDGKVVNNLTPKERNMAMVFQSYALYPHMTVAENMGFNLKLAGLKPKERSRPRVGEAARMLGSSELLQRRPAQLSGGQRQRVAMGRAVVRKPTVFLFDEPLSNLDAKLRVQMRAEIKILHQRVGTTIDLRHPRPDRGDDARGPHRGAERRPHRAAWDAARALPQAGQPLRRRLHRLAGDEFPRCDDAGERRGRAGRAGRRHEDRARAADVGQRRATG